MSTRYENLEIYEKKATLNIYLFNSLHQIPYDVMHLDIEYSDGMRYFIWDKKKWPDPDHFIRNILLPKGRKLVVIVDCHVKVDPQFYVYD
jgi:alpha-glucosidase (family GH31 glycosyl hydrolase)